MKLPQLTSPAKSHSAVTAFGGLNHTAACGEGEFYRQENLCTRAYPAVTARRPRRLLQTLEKPHGLFSCNGLLWVDGTALYYKGERVGTVADSDKQFCAIGSKVLIWPDKLSFDTESTVLSPLGAVWQATGPVELTLAREDGSDYGPYFAGTQAPDPAEYTLWADTSGEQAALWQYSATAGEWQPVSSVYVKLKAAGIGAAFARYDTVTISGVTGDLAALLNGDHNLWRCEENAVCFVGMLEQPCQWTTAEGALQLERVIPELDYLTQLDNRVWGCSNQDHCIYACKQGDPTNWFSYLGIAADSYAATVGSAGEFTGAASCLGYVLFFKEDVLHKIYGTQPSNYQVTTVACRGVQAGCAGSLAMAGESLFYKSRDGVCRYDGGLPTLVSQNLGETPFEKAVGGARFGEYCVSMQAAGGDWHLFSYDVAHSLWSRQDALQACAFSQQNGELLCLCADGRLLGFHGAEQDETVAWCGELGPIGLYNAQQQRIRRLELYFESKAGNRLTIEARYDNQPQWQPLAQVTLRCGQKMRLPLVPQRFDTVRLRLKGTAPLLLYSVAKILEQGSDTVWRI